MPEIRGLSEVVIWVHNIEESLHFHREHEPGSLGRRKLALLQAIAMAERPDVE